MALESQLPASWRVNLDLERPQARAEAGDGIIEIRPPSGRPARLLLEAKSRLLPAAGERLAANLWKSASALQLDGALIVAPFLSAGVQKALTRAGVNYWDAEGNQRIQLETPAAFIYSKGTTRDPNPEMRMLRSLKGRAAGQVTRALLDFRPPYGASDVALLAGVSVPTASRVLEYLVREGVVTRPNRGPVSEVRWQDLLETWTRDYSFSGSNRTLSYLAPRGVESVMGQLESANWQYAVTGSAAARGNRVAPFRVLALYVSDAVEAAKSLDLRESDAGTNVILAEPQGAVVFERCENVRGIIWAACSQVAADLLTGPGRWPSEGEAMIEWMSRNEDAWRR